MRRKPTLSRTSGRYSSLRSLLRRRLKRRARRAAKKLSPKLLPPRRKLANPSGTPASSSGLSLKDVPRTCPRSSKTSRASTATAS